MTNRPIISSTLPWSSSEDDIVLANYTKPWEELLVLIPGRSREAIYQRMQKHGLKRPKPRHYAAWSDEDVAYLRENYGKVPNAVLVERLARKEHAIIEYARKRGLQMEKDENGDTVNTVGKAALRRLLDGSLQSYYWIGYLMADGYMHHGLGQIVLVSAKADKGHMAAYAEYLGAKVHKYESVSDFTGLLTEHYRVSVADYRVAERIAKQFDWKPRKTYFPPSVSTFEKAFETDAQFLAFLVGFIDGDGSICKSNWSIRIENHSSWRQLHGFILDKLRNMGILDANTQANINGDGYSDFRLPKRVTLQLKSFILTHNLTVLQRKWAKIV